MDVSTNSGQYLLISEPLNELTAWIRWLLENVWCSMVSVKALIKFYTSNTTHIPLGVSNTWILES